MTELISNTASRPQADRFDALFDSLRQPDRSTVHSGDLLRALGAAGLHAGDPRLAELHRALAPEGEGLTELDREGFRRAVQSNITLVERVLRSELVLPELQQFRREIEELFEDTRANSAGEVGSYIPQLARVDSSKFALGVCTIDGQRFGLGDSTERFCLQSSCKPINYLIALDEVGPDVVHRHIGREPSGRSFNELSLNDKGRPHNPMINAGAIMSCALIGRGSGAADRFDEVVRRWTRLTGGVRPGFDNSVYLSERRTADRNFALGYFMREHDAFPEGTDLTETLEFYFQCCALELDVESFSVVAATLANGGVCPITEERVLSPQAVQKCLSLMYSCGMYDFSGEWAFTVGLPAKSGVSGVILIVVPNTLGLAVWSPRLDKHGNSVRGVEFCQRLVEKYTFHHYDNLVGHTPDKTDPRQDELVVHSNLIGELLWAASKGDLHGVHRIAARGFDLGAADYDGRTALHLAASEGRVEVVCELILRGVDRAPRDRWGGTPYDDAEREGHEEVAELLRGGGTMFAEDS